MSRTTRRNGESESERGPSRAKWVGCGSRADDELRGARALRPRRRARRWAEAAEEIEVDARGRRRTAGGVTSGGASPAVATHARGAEAARRRAANATGYKGVRSTGTDRVRCPQVRRSTRTTAPRHLQHGGRGAAATRAKHVQSFVWRTTMGTPPWRMMESGATSAADAAAPAAMTPPCSPPPRRRPRPPRCAPSWQVHSRSRRLRRRGPRRRVTHLLEADSGRAQMAATVGWRSRARVDKFVHCTAAGRRCGP